jgi:hypothetical protein
VSEQVIVHRRTAGIPDAHGNATSTYVSQTITADAVAKGSTGEPRTADRGARDLVEVLLTVFLPAGTQITDADEMTVRGRRYQVVGVPFDWVNPYTGRRPGVEVPLGTMEG